MSQAGDVVENPVTGERAIVRVGTKETKGELLISDLYIRPGGRVVGEHLHPNIEERFTLLRGSLGVKLAGQSITAQVNQTIIAPPKIPHDWWNAGSEEVLVRVEVRPAARFEAMILNMFGLAQDGKVNQQGLPSLPQLALISQEFSDVIRFTRPPYWVQKALFGPLALLGRVQGYRGSYPHYLERKSKERVEVEPLEYQ